MMDAYILEGGIEGFCCIQSPTKACHSLSFYPREAALEESRGLANRLGRGLCRAQHIGYARELVPTSPTAASAVPRFSELKKKSCIRGTC